MDNGEHQGRTAKEHIVEQQLTVTARDDARALEAEHADVSEYHLCKWNA